MISVESALRDCLDAGAIDSSDVYRYAAAGVVPACVIQPHDYDDVATAVRALGRAGLALIPTGHPTHLDVGAPPQRYDAALTTRRLDRIVAHEAGDMTVTVQAGVTLGALATALAAARQWLPLDPARAGDMTVGGLIAADRSGPSRFGYGKVRDWLIGVKVVTADGELVKGGGRVVKNVAGYDLPKLFAGSFGTLGVIVEATFKVLPLPEQEAVFIWPAPALAEALTHAAAVRGSSVFPVLIDALNEAAAETLGIDAGAGVVLACAGSPAGLDEQERRLGALSGGAARRVADEQAIGLRRALSDFSQPAAEEALVARVSGLPTVLAALLPEIEAVAQAGRTIAEIAAHAGSGVAWCQFLGAPGADALAELATGLRAAARDRGAWTVFEALPPALRGRIDPWGLAPGLRLMAGVKRALDPGGMFSPGRFVGGI
jgi:glycolate oxidase FAD binding subunit